MEAELKDFLPGSKTYIVAFGLIVTSVGAFFHGDASLIQSVEAILGGLGLAALRMGVGNGK